VLKKLTFRTTLHYRHWLLIGSLCCLGLLWLTRMHDHFNLGQLFISQLKTSLRCVFVNYFQLLIVIYLITAFFTLNVRSSTSVSLFLCCVTSGCQSGLVAGLGNCYNYNNYNCNTDARNCFMHHIYLRFMNEYNGQTTPVDYLKDSFHGPVCRTSFFYRKFL